MTKALSKNPFAIKSRENRARVRNNILALRKKNACSMCRLEIFPGHGHARGGRITRKSHLVWS